MKYSDMELNKTARIEARVLPEDKQLFRKAATLSGRSSLSDFVIQTLKDAAQKIIKEHKIIELTKTDQDLFVKSLIEDSKPNSRLITAVKHHNKIVKE
ncbi:DUF1778 domain-containing protein [Legionella israelensis]|uniref:DUF1778 domain-containing protein n=1 Tax=Legionella israelensis TaxID=454 RepID=A0A0W0VKW3_9GAMM|nr:DUF1778 domain-containing protein [Legionella israelensis]KTD20605.1 hypothetical protein Lisr_1699 [Legionella israelensis]QBS09822.1 DUF1778 domain-containing protein [Legionella israelensis]SCY13269.1 Uncharacterized conserved protein, DUF1778 family [Legionella israelensis DSM 19235]STX59374.1 Uncharacterized protein conserved in bacteria [Legionella israelensis]